MPRKDGTGPSGKGPQTGRGLGICRGNKSRDGLGACGELGLGRGQGGSGRGFGRDRRR